MAMVDDRETLFDLEPVLIRKITPRSLVERRRALARTTKMRGVYGAGPSGARCGSCEQLLTRGRYFKCAMFGDTRSEASDWRKRWPACGRYTPREATTP